MLNPRLPMRGLVAALLALMVQLALGAIVPNAEARQALGEAPICHTDDSGGTVPSSPAPLPDCRAGPLCAPVHASATAVLPMAADATPAPHLYPLARPELPPPATAPPSVDWPPNQP